MSEETTNIIPMEERMKAPDVSNFNSLVDVAKRTPLFGFPKNNLDRIYKFWTHTPNITKNIVRMDKATRLVGIPINETDQAKVYLKDLVEVTEPILESMRDFCSKPASERTWRKDGKPIYETIHNRDKSEDVGNYERSITALLEAISETQGKGWTTEEQMRQKIAQHSLEELWNSCVYARLQYAADTEINVTTIDSLNEEKDEFLFALNKKVWTEEELSQQKKMVNGLRRVIVEEYDDTYLDKIKILWDSASGKAGANTTAIDLFIASEEIFQSLSYEGAFEWDPEEETDEDEEE